MMRNDTSSQRGRSARGVVLALALFVLSGCGGRYAIEGRVIQGPVAAIQLVDNDDYRITESNPTGSGAVIQGLLEPDIPTERQALGRHVADRQGRFKIPVDAVGAGFLEYEAQLIVRRSGYRGVMETIDLPRRGQAVLVTLPLGADTLVVPEDYLDRALRDAEPYLRDNQ